VRATPIAVPPTPIADEPDDIFPAKKKTGKVVAVSLGALVLLLGVAGGIKVLGRNGSTEPTAAAPSAAAEKPAPTHTEVPPAPVVAAPAATVVPTPTAEPTPPPPDTAPAAAPTAQAPLAEAPAAPTRAAAAHAKGAKAAKPVVESAPAPPPPAPRPAPRPAVTAVFPAETAAPAPKASPSKSVIVRDAPF